MNNQLSDDLKVLYNHYTTHVLSVAQEHDQDHLGSHYLWGANGGRPDNKIVPGNEKMSSNVKTCNNVLSDKDNDALFYAACAHIEGKLYICLGRCAQNKVIEKPFADIVIDNPPAQTDKRWARSWGIIEKNSVLQNNYNLMVPEPLKRPPKNPRFKNDLIWGEYCLNKQHFDCSHFVEWTFKQMLDLGGATFSPQDVVNLTDPISLNDAQAGDIAFEGTEHIGFVVKPGTYTHAEWELTGVVTNNYKKWDRFGRLNAKFWSKVKGIRVPQTIIPRAEKATTG